MNERLKELITEAFDTAEYPADQKYRIEPNKVFCQKFAELIVAECIGIVENLSPGYKDYRDQIEDAFRRDCVIEIKNRFGVE